MEVYKDCGKAANGKNKYQSLDLFDCLPFFSCPNKIYDQPCLDDIRKYLYCKETNTPAYKGSYSDTPKIWIDKYFALNHLEGLIEIRSHERATRKAKSKGTPLK